MNKIEILKKDFQEICKKWEIEETDAKPSWEKIKNFKTPKAEDVFNAFKIGKNDNIITPEEVKVLILGQDPYPSTGKNKGRAHGLAFSFGNGDKPDDSLLNIFKAIQVYKNDMKQYFCDIDGNDVQWETNLQTWASNNKVLLLNTALTYNSNNDKTEHQKSWEAFVQQVIKKLLTDNNKMTIFLWGVDAQKTFLKCLSDNEKLNNYLDNFNQLSQSIKREVDNKFIFKEYKYKLISNREAIKITDNIKIYMTSHPSNTHNAVKQGFCCNAPKHFKACDEFLFGENEDEYIWKNFPENKQKI